MNKIVLATAGAVVGFTYPLFGVIALGAAAAIFVALAATR